MNFRLILLSCTATLVSALATMLFASPSYAEVGAYETEQVSWRSGDAEISGTLLTPEGEGPHPAVVLVHGSGPVTRSSLMTQPEIQGEGIAESFAGAGITTLVYDKRGSGESTGGGDYTYDELARDALGGVRLLRGRDDVDPDEVGLWGISEGGWIVPLAASRSDDVAFAVVVSASGYPPASQELWAIRNNLDYSHAPKSLMDATTKAWKVVYGASALPVPESARRALGNLHFDPVQYWRHVDQPVLAVYGAQDKAVPPSRSAVILEQTLSDGGNQDHRILTFTDTSHSILISSNGFDYPPGKLRYTPGYLAAMSGWVLAETDNGGPGISESVLTETSGQTPASGPPLIDPDEVPFYGSAGIQVILIIVFVVVFACAVAVGAVSMLRRRRREFLRTPGAESWVIPLTTAVCVLDLAVLIGFLAFISKVISVEGLGPPPLWTALQALETLSVVLTVTLLAATTAEIYQGTSMTLPGRTARLLVVASAILFVPFLLYWDLVFPGS